MLSDREKLDVVSGKAMHLAPEVGLRSRRAGGGGAGWRESRGGEVGRRARKGRTREVGGEVGWRVGKAGREEGGGGGHENPYMGRFRRALLWREKARVPDDFMAIFRSCEGYLDTVLQSMIYLGDSSTFACSSLAFLPRLLLLLLLLRLRFVFAFLLLS